MFHEIHLILPQNHEATIDSHYIWLLFLLGVHGSSIVKPGNNVISKQSKIWKIIFHGKIITMLSCGRVWYYGIDNGCLGGNVKEKHRPLRYHSGAANPGEKSKIPAPVCRENQLKKSLSHSTVLHIHLLPSCLLSHLSITFSFALLSLLARK